MRSGQLITGAVLLAALGCGSIPAITDNPTTVASANYDLVWEATVQTVEKYFDIAYESRYDGRIETKPLASATLLEPWRLDAVGAYQKLEATLQTIRRRCFVLVQPSPGGGFQVTVEVYKELENLQKPVYTQFGGSTFITSIEPIQEGIVTSAVRPSDGWISLGRDLKLEALLLQEIQHSTEGLVPLDGALPSPAPPPAQVPTQPIGTIPPAPPASVTP